MPTTPNGFWYPDRYDTVNSISGLFAQQAASADAALDNRVLKDGVPKFSSPVERDAAFAIIPPIKGSLSYIESEEVYERWNGITWVPAFSQTQPFITLLIHHTNIISGENALSPITIDAQYGEHGVSIGPGTKGAPSILMLSGSYEFIISVEHSTIQASRYYTGVKWDDWGNALGTNAIIQDGAGTRFISATQFLHPDTDNRPLYAVSTYTTTPSYIRMIITIRKIM